MCPQNGFQEVSRPIRPQFCLLVNAAILIHTILTQQGSITLQLEQHVLGSPFP